MSDSLISPQEGREVIRVVPDEMRWEHLGFHVWKLPQGDRLEVETAGRETAIVPMSGTATAEVGSESFELSRSGVFDDAASLLYVPPAVPTRLIARTDCVVAIGSAPADGRYPVRLITPAEVQVEIRGGGTARRQVNHLLAPPLPAERLIVYEVFVPGGSWAGWPPHRHDGLHDSPYLEETYFFRFDRPDGFGFHRNYVGDESYDETITVRDQECVVVPCGFHVTTAAPGHNMWILNFLAGELIGDQRATPPYYDPSTTWITEDWSTGSMSLPVTTQGERTADSAAR
jgi:5-deoxy-glucuronate isomerase